MSDFLEENIFSEEMSYELKYMIKCTKKVFGNHDRFGSGVIARLL